MVETVYVRDTSNGRVHKRFTEDGTHLASFESCNADDAGAYSVLTEVEMERVEYADLCRRCFKEKE